jgi:hypothetical protein
MLRLDKLNESPDFDWPMQDQLLAEPVLKVFNQAQHPRQPAGSAQGGQFAPKHGGVLFSTRNMPYQQWQEHKAFEAAFKADPNKHIPEVLKMLGFTGPINYNKTNKLSHGLNTTLMYYDPSDGSINVNPAGKSGDYHRVVKILAHETFHHTYFQMRLKVYGASAAQKAADPKLAALANWMDTPSVSALHKAVKGISGYSDLVWGDVEKGKMKHGQGLTETLSEIRAIDVMRDAPGQAGPDAAKQWANIPQIWKDFYAAVRDF